MQEEKERLNVFYLLFTQSCSARVPDPRLSVDASQHDLSLTGLLSLPLPIPEEEGRFRGRQTRLPPARGIYCRSLSPLTPSATRRNSVSQVFYHLFERIYLLLHSLHPESKTINST
jgi:hypothetical protein